LLDDANELMIQHLHITWWAERDSETVFEDATWPSLFHRSVLLISSM